MPTSTRLSLVAALLALAACSSSTSIGKYPDGSSSKDGVGSQGDTISSPFCRAITQACATGADCCSGICDPTSATCAGSINQCTSAGGGCLAATECCSMVCAGSRCGATACIADGQACADSASCCGGSCVGGLCQALNPACLTAGNPCSTNAQCCSTLCSGGVCQLGASFCIQTGDACSDSSTCCSGDCQKGTGTLGVCAAPPSGATYCSDGVDGTVCGACNNCCSRLCAPYAPTGVYVCQPASGCRVNGDLCRKDSDCCGAAGTGLPGDGNVTCEIDAGKAVGICRNPRSCNPQGNVCHYKDYTCSISSARNDCCAAVGNSGVCQLDFLGVPRCNGLGDSCIAPGQICASAMDCCGQLPCVPDGTGLLRCYMPPGGLPDGGLPGVDGGVPLTCVPSGGPCSYVGDCCKGSLCLFQPGSTQGICGVPTPPISGPDAGSTDTPSLGCAAYGQTCTSAADCCNGITCWNGRCMDAVIP
jgi:hypothetical protein